MCLCTSPFTPPHPHPHPELLQLHARVAELSAAKVANAAKLAELKGGGARLVSAGDVQKAEKVCKEQVGRGVSASFSLRG